MINNRIQKSFLLAVSVLLITYSFPVFSCDIPVFRYALERWAAEAYEVIVFHNGSLSPEDSSVIKFLDSSSNAGISHGNYLIKTVDLTTKVSPQMLGIWETLHEPELPCLAVRYPDSFPFRQSIWNIHLSKDTAKTLVDSPVRQEIAQRITMGDTAVWILIECGDNTKDDATANFIESQLSALEKTLKLPQAVPEMMGDTSENAPGIPDVSIAFSLIRVSRKDKAESALIAMLMHSEPDLFEYTSHPMVFPVYGRGRALFALIGEGITERNIHMACEYITGACSCEIKALNPGVDLLIDHDWEKAIMDSWFQEIELPPLVGLSELVHTASADDSLDSTLMSSESSDEITAGADSASYSTAAMLEDNNNPSRSSLTEENVTSNTDIFGEGKGTHVLTGHLFRNILLALGVIIMVIGILTLKVGLQKTGDKK